MAVKYSEHNKVLYGTITSSTFQPGIW